MSIIQFIGLLIQFLLARPNRDKVYRVAGYLSSDRTVTVTRRRYNGKLLKGRKEFCVTVGPPNYIARRKIKKLQAEGCKFPMYYHEVKRVRK